jgi:hypothetical protein
MGCADDQTLQHLLLTSGTQLPSWTMPRLCAVEAASGGAHPAGQCSSCHTLCLTCQLDSIQGIPVTPSQLFLAGWQQECWQHSCQASKYVGIWGYLWCCQPPAAYHRDSDRLRGMLTLFLTSRDTWIPGCAGAQRTPWAVQAKPTLHHSCSPFAPPAAQLDSPQQVAPHTQQVSAHVATELLEMPACFCSRHPLKSFHTLVLAGSTGSASFSETLMAQPSSHPSI